jgi:hypothetical protein
MAFLLVIRIARVHPVSRCGYWVSHAWLIALKSIFAS